MVSLNHMSYFISEVTCIIVCVHYANKCMWYMNITAFIMCVAKSAKNVFSTRSFTHSEACSMRQASAGFQIMQNVFCRVWDHNIKKLGKRFHQHSPGKNGYVCITGVRKKKQLHLINNGTRQYK
uniref:Uncharacterized protein n=1 Tax=Rhipicephalus microplus TaxID=6941 RepID=A0A6G5AF08_RHIMP